MTAAPPHRADPRCPVLLLGPVYAAYVQMKGAAEQAGLPERVLTIVSGYRSVADQRELWDRALQRYGSAEEARKRVAPPGASARHTGRVVDLVLGAAAGAPSVPALRITPAYRWLERNAARFGFLPHASEPWSWEHRGVPPAPSETAGAPAERPFREEDLGARLPGFGAAETKAIRITAAFELAHASEVDALDAGSEGPALSLGMLPWSVARGDLRPLLSALLREDPRVFHGVFGADADRARVILATGAGEPPEQRRHRQLDLARSVDDWQRCLTEPWAGHLHRLMAAPSFERIRLRDAWARMAGAVQRARALGLRSERGLALIWDIAAQNGFGWLSPGPRLQHLAVREAEASRSLGRGLHEKERLEVIANAVADAASPRCKEDVRARKLTIVRGEGVVRGRRFDLRAEVGLTDAPF